MARARNLLNFEASRLEPGAGEEVRVGAYARRQFRRRVLLGVFGALLITGAFVLYQLLNPRGNINDAERYPIRVRCVSCGYTTALRVRAAQTFPMECSACRKTTAQQLWKCRSCGALFVPQRTGMERRCPECNSQRVGSAAAP
jgi:predicted Zn-ribbon and HTH transcriptional regulator